MLTRRWATPVAGVSSSRRCLQRTPRTCWRSRCAPEWLIDQDRPDDAILNLRTALDQAPRDPQIMSLMAGAYLRGGSRELAGEMLSLAVEASNNAPEESDCATPASCRRRKIGVAEPILIDALRLAPNNPAILIELGRVYLAQEDWPRLEQVEATLRRLEHADEPPGPLPTALLVARLQGRNRDGRGGAPSSKRSCSSRARAPAALEIVRTHLRNGDLEAAENFVDGRALPRTPRTRSCGSSRRRSLPRPSRADQAEAIYRDCFDENPTESEAVWRTLYVLLNREGRFDEARADPRRCTRGPARGAEPAVGDWPANYEREGDIEALSPSTRRFTSRTRIRSSSPTTSRA
jgi:cellulose synthase operon protein C